MPRHFAVLVLFLAATSWAACSDTRKSSATKIVGGSLASHYPFMAGLTYEGNDRSFCGGTFISPSVVVTAAHCIQLDNHPPLKVSMGLDLNSQHHTAKLFSVEAVKVHPHFDRRHMQNDIALIFLSTYDPLRIPADFAPLPLNMDPANPAASGGTGVKVIGWGNTTSFGSLFEDELRELTIPVIEPSLCRQDYGPSMITEGQLCAGDQVSGAKDSCQGDSGGPLLGVNKQGKPILVGIVSWGNGCAQKAKPGVYTKVSAQTDWINKEMERFEINAAQRDGEDIAYFVRSFCDTKLAKTVLNTRTGLSSIAVKNYYSPGADFALMEPAALPNQIKSGAPSCSFALSDTKIDVTVVFGLESEAMLVATEVTSGVTWSAPAIVSNKVTLACSFSSNSLTLSKFSDDFDVSSVLTDDEYYLLDGPFLGEISPLATRKSCAIGDHDFAFITQTNAATGKDEYLVSINSSYVIDPVHIYSLKLHGIEAHTGDVSINFKPNTPTTGRVDIVNDLDVAIHTWQLDCNFEFSLTDIYGAQFAPVKVAGLYRHKFIEPSTIHGSIAAGSFDTFKFEAAEPMPADGSQNCSINGQYVSTLIGPLAN